MNSTKDPSLLHNIAYSALMQLLLNVDDKVAAPHYVAKLSFTCGLKKSFVTQCKSNSLSRLSKQFLISSRHRRRSFQLMNAFQNSFVCRQLSGRSSEFPRNVGEINLSSSQFRRRFYPFMFAVTQKVGRKSCGAMSEKGRLRFVCQIVPCTFFNYFTSLQNSQSMRKARATARLEPARTLAVVEQQRSLSFILRSDKVQKKILSCRHIPEWFH